jgi:hypothetical protein
MPFSGFHESYPTMYGELFLAAFALASILALLAGVLLLVREAPLQRAVACAALVVVGIALAASCGEVLHLRESTDALLARHPDDTACEYELLRHEGFGQARENARLALWAAPFALALATFVAARSLRRQAFLGWAAVPWALFAAAGFLYLQPVPGLYLWAGRCELYDDRDAMRSSRAARSARFSASFRGGSVEARIPSAMPLLTPTRSPPRSEAAPLKHATSRLPRPPEREFSASFRGGSVEATRCRRMRRGSRWFSASFRGGSVEARWLDVQRDAMHGVLRLVQRRLR